MFVAFVPANQSRQVQDAQDEEAVLSQIWEHAAEISDSLPGLKAKRGAFRAHISSAAMPPRRRAISAAWKKTVHLRLGQHQYSEIHEKSEGSGSRRTHT